MSDPTMERASTTLVRRLQTRLVRRLQAVAQDAGHAVELTPIDWLRDGGRHGGGTRYSTGDGAVFDRASVNVSVVHYRDVPDKRLRFTAALSAIVHPAHPHAPSMHTHLSWTELAGGRSGWRWMADLNPAIPEAEATGRFEQALLRAAPRLAPAALAQGDRYFFIPALDRHRGVVHFYVEGHHDEPERDLATANTLGDAIIDTYGRILGHSLASHGPPSASEQAAQLAYHTLYFLQVLTLDRGTTTGLLAHTDNDVGVLGSLPSRVSPRLLASWLEQVDPVQRPLLEGLLAALPTTEPALVDIDTKRRLVTAVRGFYAHYPEALTLQARGDVLPGELSRARS